MAGGMNRFARGVIVAMAAAALACPDTAQVPVATPPDALPAGTILGQGSITGRVIYTGEPAKPETISMASDATCRHRNEGEPLREDLLVGPDGGLANAFVHLSSGPGARAFAPPETPVVLDQRGCTYRPHVVGIQVGQPLQLLNSDPTLHNVHTVSQANKPFNFGMSVEGQKAIRYFAQPEVMIRAKCDVHPWMSSFIGVVTHPYFAVSDATGRFVIDNLPAGEHVIEVWHEKLGVRQQTVTLGDGEKKEISFSYPG